MKIELTKGQVEQLLNLVKVTNFQGGNAQQVLDIIKALEKGLDTIENKSGAKK